MNRAVQTRLADILRKHESEILTSWLQHQRSAVSTGSRLISEAEAGEQSRQFLALLTSAISSGNLDLMASEWTELQNMLSELSRTRARQGFTPSQTATFIFSLKQPLFECLRQEFPGDAKALAEETWTATMLLDKLGLLTAEAHQK